jgi:hypothetical protein
MDIIEYATGLMCHEQPILAPHQYNDKTINQVILGMQLNGYDRFIWTYPISKRGGGNQQQVTRYTVIVGYPYEAEQEDYSTYLKGAEDYLNEWLRGLNRAVPFVVTNIGEFQSYPMLNQVFEGSQALTKFPCYYAAASANFDLLM